MSQRSAARGLLVTPQRELLLMLMALPWKKTPIWVAPGGGLRGAETWEHALQRELQEETGYCASQIGPHVWERTITLSSDGSLTQRERYYLIRVQRFEPLSHALEQDERGWFRGFRWWALRDLSHCEAVDVGPELLGIIEASLAVV